MKHEKLFNKPKVLRLAKNVLKRSACSNCLGRQLAQISTGMTNQERGKLLRKLLKSPEPKGKCPICSGLFKNLEHHAKKAKKAVQGIEFSSFLVGSKISNELLEKEESLWEAVGIEHCEPLKSELNRELGKLLHRTLGKNVDEKSPDIIIILNLQKSRIELDVRPLFICGAYKKLARGLPQTKWDTYTETVEDIIAKPLMKASKAKAHALHGAGREDIDARCLDWRPFVFELDSPKKRKISLRKMEKEINTGKKVKVKDLRPSDKKEVIRVKAIRPDKSYRVLVSFEKPLKKNGLSPLKNLIGTINQKTPSRVLHRRADLLRKRRVKKISAKAISGKKALIEVRGEAGLYVKELVTGDSGRTSPSVAELLGPTKVEELDVIKIHLKKEKH